MCGGLFIFKMTKTDLKIILDHLYEEAQISCREHEIPVSACLVLEDGRQFYSHNEVEKYNDPFMHAEFSVIDRVLKLTDSRYLKNSTLIVTMEPCLLCMGAIIKAGVSSLYYVLPDEKGGSLSHYHAFVDDKLKVSEIEDARFKKLMNDFFNTLRNQEKK